VLGVRVLNESNLFAFKLLPELLGMAMGGFMAPDEVVN